MDEDYFISGSLDAKVRMWNIPARLVVDWTDTHEMVTAVSYTPDGQVCIFFSSPLCFKKYQFFYLCNNILVFKCVRRCYNNSS